MCKICFHLDLMFNLRFISHFYAVVIRIITFQNTRCAGNAINEQLRIEELQRGQNFSLIWSHPFVGIYFVNNGTNSMSFEMVRIKKIYCQNVFLTESITLRLLFRPQCRCNARLGTASDLNYVDTIQSMNGIVC